MESSGGGGSSLHLPYTSTTSRPGEEGLTPLGDMGTLPLRLRVPVIIA